MPSWRLGISKVCYSTRIIPSTIDPTHIDALLTMVDCGEVLKSVFNYAIEQYDQGYAKMTIITDHALVVWGTVGFLSDVKFPQNATDMAGGFQIVGISNVFQAGWDLGV